jgi:glutamate-ammonia-ligase adenylyltransferase
MVSWQDAWPEAGNPATASLLVERLDAAMARWEPGERALLQSAAARAMIACLGGNSPYLAELAVREVLTLAALERDGPDAVVADALARLETTDRKAARGVVAAALRTAKRQVALATAVADLGGHWILEEVTAALSRLAERCLSVAVEHLLGEAARVGRLLPSAADGRGFVVIGMGKLGAGELNYSSDVDLLLLYEPEADRDPDDAASTFSRIARDLVALMQARDADGYVFRVDLRLRPDPEASPPALPVGSALTYYEASGETWERAALSKARPVAGDLALGARFLGALAPFVWRRHLDFAAIDEMRAMKARIDRRQRALRAGPPGAALAGRDIKLGEGGIREIEFVAQTLQLVWGGREPALREAATLPALRALAAHGRLPMPEAEALARAYRALRQVEHRLQMVADRQTHALPGDEAGLAAFARFMGERDVASLSGRLRSVLLPVHRIFRAMFEGGDDGWDAAAASLAALPFTDQAATAALVERWRSGGPRALRHERARAMFGVVVGGLLSALARQREPDQALARFARLLDRLSAGVQLFSLLARNAVLVDRLADLLGASPALADHLAAVPSALEGLVGAAGIDAFPLRALRAELDGRSGGETVEVAVDTTRRFVRGEEFRLALAQLEGRIDVDRAGTARAALADAAITVLLTRVAREHRARFGRIPGGGMVVVALGKAGSREMMGASDLDLMMIYDAPDGAESEGVGVRALPASAFYGRLSQRLVSAITAPGLDGALYDVDMRLRPSGSKGPVAVSLAAFEAYHVATARTWERMALTRARIVAGPAWLRRRVTAAIGMAIALAGPARRTRADAVAMRARLLRDKPGEGAWDVKMRAGGLVEVEFIAQALQLDPRIGTKRRHVTTRRALRACEAAGLLSGADARTLIAADRFWRTIQSLLRLMGGTAIPRGTVAPRLRELVAGGVGVEADAIEAHMDATGHRVRSIFERHLGQIDETTGDV